MKILVLLLAIMLTGCAKTHWEECNWPLFTIQTKSPKPTILVIGDSISLGYTPIIASKYPNYDVIHDPCNPTDSSVMAEFISNWLSIDDQYAAVIFNSGLHDATFRYHISDSEYENSLRITARYIKSVTKHGVFMLSTQIQPNSTFGLDSRVIELNNIAITVMAQEGIPVLDLYSVSATIPNKHLGPDNVHYTYQGYTVLANAIETELLTLFGVQ